MTGAGAIRSGQLSFDLDDGPLDLEGVDFARSQEVVVALSISALGSANTHISISLSLLDVAWSVETLAAEADAVAISSGGYFNRRVTATFTRPKAAFARALANVALIFNEDDLDNSSPELQAQLEEIGGRIGDFQENISKLVPKCPEVVDWYLADLVLGANHEWCSEAPDYVLRQFAQFPERRFRYFRSSYSEGLGDTCFCTDTGWILSADIELDAFFSATRQKYRVAEFLPAELTIVAGSVLALAPSVAARFPVADFLHGASCIGALMDTQTDEVALLDPPTRHGAAALLQGAGDLLVHSSGTLVIVQDDVAQYMLYGAEPVPQAKLALLVAPAAEAQARLARFAGFGQSINCPWGQLDDDQFEELCYDIVRLHPQIETSSVRKLGKSRSRDGGRDIEAYEVQRSPNSPPVKWIFQCKLITSGGSLSGRKLQDVGDTLDQYGAGGFGVMTSAPIDATLYDKLDALCSRRGIKQQNYSVYELERQLLLHADLRYRFFK
jgi:hypothetical protein